MLRLSKEVVQDERDGTLMIHAVDIHVDPDGNLLILQTDEDVDGEMSYCDSVLLKPSAWRELLKVLIMEEKYQDFIAQNGQE